MTTRRPGGGRKPKPSKQKQKEGNKGKRGVNKQEPVFDVVAIGAPDTLIDDHAVKAWGFYCPGLLAVGVLTVVDAHNLEQFCNALSYVKQMDEDIKENGHFVEGKAGLKKNPAHTIRNENLRNMITFGSVLGLDPASRQRLIGPDQGRKKENAFTKAGL